jgi:hypothetical protein
MPFVKVYLSFNPVVSSAVDPVPAHRGFPQISVFGKPLGISKIRQDKPIETFEILENQRLAYTLACAVQAETVAFTPLYLNQVNGR